MGHRLNHTIFNARWWLLLPALLPLALLSFVMTVCLAKPLWWLGQLFCRLSDWDVPTPPWMDRVLEWGRAGSRTDAATEKVE